MTPRRPLAAGPAAAGSRPPPGGSMGPSLRADPSAYSAIRVATLASDRRRSERMRCRVTMAIAQANSSEMIVTVASVVFMLLRASARLCPDRCLISFVGRAGTAL